MPKILVTIGFCALAGCATSTQIERQAREHDRRADVAAQMRDYDRAATEKHEAAKLHAKAVHRAYKEGAAATVGVPTTPQEVPHPPPPAP
jgi:hypothetical protein